MTLHLRTSHVIAVALCALLLIATATATGVAAGSKISGKKIAKHSIPANKLTRSALADLEQRVKYVDRSYTTTAPGTQTVPFACPNGTQVIGGYVKPGWSAGFNTAEAYVNASNEFVVRVTQLGDTPGSLTVQLICINEA